MKIFSCIVLLVAIAMASGHKPHYNIKDAPKLFEKFIRDYDRHYKSEADKMEHYEAFVNTLHKINKSNAESPAATFDINEFADYTPQELEKIMGLTKPVPEDPNKE